MTSLQTLRFEPLDPRHIPAILDIEKESNTAPWSERSFRNELDNPHSIFVVAMLKGEVVGYGGIWKVVDEAHVTTVSVAASARRQGIGERIMLELLKRAKADGMTCSTLEVRAGNEAAIRLYEKLGYIDTARRRGYYPDNKEDAVVMWLNDLQDWSPPRP